MSRGFDPLMFGPFALIRRMQADIDRMLGAPLAPAAREDGGMVSDPPIETFQRGDEYVIRVDAPGLSREDITVDIGDDAVTISGERREEKNEERDGVHVSEVRYGAFARVVPLPPTARADDARATLRDGVLEIVVPAPQEQRNRGRRIEIQGGSQQQSGQSQQQQQQQASSRS
jgi:HSP20 family protein